MTDSFKVGDRIKFKSATRDSFRVETRVIRDIDELGRPLVRYFGWRNFVVRSHEIISVVPS
jgi:hypothetical protein